jgi:type I restriction enzyme R subunit
LSETTARDFETRAGMPPEAFIERLKTMPLADIAAWFTHNPDLADILDREGEGRAEPMFVSHHDDRLLGTERGYGQAKRPEDCLQEFSDFIRSRSNVIPALITVLTRPRELTRKQLRELVLELDKAGFSEASLATAWREMTNQDIAARIVGYIRQAAIGDPLVPYDQRVDSALRKYSPRATGPRRSASGCRRSLPRPSQRARRPRGAGRPRSCLQARGRRLHPTRPHLRWRAPAGAGHLQRITLGPRWPSHEENTNNP